MPMSSATLGKTTKNFRHVADARWLMSYAAGLGDFNESYFDTTQGVVGHPVFPVCVEWPVILDVRNVEGSNSMTFEEAARGVHASHDLHIHRLVQQDEELFTNATVIGVEQRQPGAYQVLRIDTLDREGQPVATTYQGGLWRGVNVLGEDKSIAASPELPAIAEANSSGDRVFELDVSPHAAHVYTECARIWNPIHTDKAVALAAGLPDIILHGTATLALAVSKIIRECLDLDPTRVRRVACRFAAMVRMPSTLKLVIDARSESGIWFTVFNTEDKPAIRGGYLGIEP